MKTTTAAWISDNTFQISLFTQDTISGQSGLELGKLLDEVIQSKQNQVLYISFHGVDNITPSFVNGALIYLIDLYGEDYFRQYIKVGQGKANLMQAIGQQIKSHIEQRKAFIQKFAPYKIYCGIDNSHEGSQLRYQLYEMTPNKSRFLFNPNDSNFSQNARTKIQEASSFIGFLTTESHQHQEALLKEANYAISLGKPTLLMVRKGLQVASEIQQQVQIVYFDTHNQWQTLRNINQIILQNQTQQSTIHTKKQLTFDEVLVWGALGAALVILVALLLSKDE